MQTRPLRQPLLLLLLGCAPDPAEAPSPRSAPVVVAEPETFRLTGRAAHEGTFAPGMPASVLGKDCAAVNEALHTSGPPCLAERWQSDTRAVLFLHAPPTGSLAWDGSSARPTRVHWSSLGRTLAACLEDPFMVPPARDPGGARSFAGDRWVLVFSGQNACRLHGRLVLPLEADHADLSALVAFDRPWFKGGREAVEQALTTPR